MLHAWKGCGFGELNFPRHSTRAIHRVLIVVQREPRRKPMWTLRRSTEAIAPGHRTGQHAFFSHRGLCFSKKRLIKVDSILQLQCKNCRNNMNSPRMQNKLANDRAFSPPEAAESPTGLPVVRSWGRWQGMPNHRLGKSWIGTSSVSLRCYHPRDMSMHHGPCPRLAVFTKWRFRS